MHAVASSSKSSSKSLTNNICDRFGGQRKTMTVYWIYKDEDDQSQDSSNTRIFFLYDPVTILKTAIGGWTNERLVSRSHDLSQPIRGEEEWSAEGQRRNIESFRATLDTLSGQMSRLEQKLDIIH